MSETRTHLREVARVGVRGDILALHGERVLVGATHVDPHELAIVDLSVRDAPRVLSRLRFRQQMQAIALVGPIAYVHEYHRAIHFVKLDDPVRPTVDDCLLMFDQDVYRFAHAGARWLVLARNWEGVSVLDISDPEQPRETDLRKLGESFVEGVVVAGERIFAAAHEDGLVELRIDGDGKLVEVGRWLGGEDGFKVCHVHVTGDHLRVFGNGTLPYGTPATEPEPDEDGESDPDSVTFALSDLATPRWYGASGQQPARLRALPDGSAIGFSGYRCYRFPVGGKAELLFAMFSHDDTHDYQETSGSREEGLGREYSCFSDVGAWLRLGDHLLVQQPEHMRVFAIDPSSPLAGLPQG